jgi:hypothetical protein
MFGSGENAMRQSLLIAVFSLFAVGSEAFAQQSLYTRSKLSAIQQPNTVQNYSSQRLRNNIYRNAVPQYAYNTLNRNIFQSSLTGRPLQKPFSSSGGRPSVSPYLGLSAPFSSTAEQYYTQVRPQLQQQRVNQQLAQRNAQMQHQLNAVAAQSSAATTANEGLVPTGHVAAFMNYGGYYTPVDQPRR